VNLPPPRHPALLYLCIALRARIAAARTRDSQRGASVVEWVVISMIVISLVAFVGYLITQAVQSKARQVSTCIGTAGSTQDC
jgi:hypothetical protein